MSGSQFPDRQRRGSALLTWFLVALTTAGLVLGVGGTAYAVYANTPANREGNAAAPDPQPR
jgi:uncharacterized membrane protein YebE (DUF533 family)